MDNNEKIKSNKYQYCVNYRLTKWEKYCRINNAFEKMVDVAQLVRAPGCGPGGRGFESHLSPH